MNEELVFLAHWPYVQRHLAVGRRPAVSRLLDLLVRCQAETLEPTPISAAWLARWGMTAGEAGRARTIALELEDAAVLRRWRGAGPRPDLWAVNSRIERWRIPWRLSARSVSMAIHNCTCEVASGGLTGTARLGGSGGNSFVLAADDHLAVRRIIPSAPL